MVESGVKDHNPNLRMSVSGPIVSIVITKSSCRVAMFTGSLMLASGMVSTAFVPDINWAFLTFGVLAGIVTYITILNISGNLKTPKEYVNRMQYNGHKKRTNNVL